MDTAHIDHTDYLDVDCTECRTEHTSLGLAATLPPPMPEWRRRSLEGRNRFDAVSDMTDRVAGR